MGVRLADSGCPGVSLGELRLLTDTDGGGNRLDSERGLLACYALVIS